MLQKQIIRKHAIDRFREGMTVLVHSYSDTVLDVLQHVADKGVKINVITTEAHPSNTG